jgi:hypothetical protein
LAILAVEGTDDFMMRDTLAIWDNKGEIKGGEKKSRIVK